MGIQRTRITGNYSTFKILKSGHFLLSNSTITFSIRHYLVHTQRWAGRTPNQRNMLCFFSGVVLLMQSYDSPSGSKQFWRLSVNTSQGAVRRYNITTTKRNTTKPCAYFVTHASHRFIKLLWIMSKSTVTKFWNQRIFCQCYFKYDISGNRHFVGMTIKWKYLTIIFIELLLRVDRVKI